MNIFPTKILLAIDASKDAGLAAKAAIELANTTGSELHLVYVTHLLTEASEASYMAARLYQEMYEEAKQEAQRLLDEQVRMIEEAGGRVADTHLRIGRPDEEVIRLGEELRAGLVVVGSRGLSPIRRALMGSVSDSVVRHAHCPVMVVRGEENGEIIFWKRILLATDGSKDAELAARIAADITQKGASELQVVHVGPSAGYNGGGEPLVTDIFAPTEEQLKELNKEHRQLLDAQVKQIEAAGGAVRKAHLRMGRPDEEIIALAEEIGAGLVVMGCRGLGGVKRALMGSVSDSVVRYAHCPVLVVRMEEGARLYPESSASTARR